MKFNPTRFKSLSRWFLGLFGLLLLDAVAFAQTGFSPNATISAIQTANETAIQSDIATSIMENLFGSIYSNPMSTVGGATTLFGVVFLAFNVVVFAAGVSWATYGVGSGVVQSAYEGEVLGKRMSAIWMPIRMVTGIGTLVPAFGGFSLSQVIMILATSWGITFGNYAYLEAIRAASSFTPLVTMKTPAVGDRKTVDTLANAIFLQELCLIDHEQAKAAYGSPTLAPPELTLTAKALSTMVDAADSAGTVYGNNLDPLACLGVGIQKKNYSVSSWSFGFTVASVNYEDIAKSSFLRYKNNYPAFESAVRVLARNWTNAILVAQANKSAGAVLFPRANLTAIANSFTGIVKASADAAGASGTAKATRALTDAAELNMKKYGFMGAGAFYSTFAEMSSAIARASDAVDFVVLEPNNRTVTTAQSVDVSRFQKAYADAQSPKAAPTDSGGAFTSSTGNVSMGQTIVEVLVGKTLTSGGVPSTGSMPVIDPIISAKNLGDYMMGIGETILFVSSAVGEPGENKNGSLLSKATGAAIEAASWIVKPIGWLKNIAQNVLQLAPMLGGMMLAVGALLSLYIPLVPFINWVSALIQYVSVVVEAIAAAPLWSFAHLQPDGEGMGQRSERGYLYLLLLLFKPILMVVGFFAASGLVVLLGSAVTWLFIPAMNNAQGNSVTGLFSVIGFSFIYFLLLNTIIQGLFNLIMDLSDDVIGWVGSVGKSQIGRDTESKAHSVFAMGGRFGSQASERMSGGMKVADVAGKSAAGGVGGGGGGGRQGAGNSNKK